MMTDNPASVAEAREAVIEAWHWKENAKRNNYTRAEFEADVDALIAAARREADPRHNDYYGGSAVFDRMPKIKMTTSGVLHEVYEERIRQQQKWGEQNHPDGTNAARNKNFADEARALTEEAAKGGVLSWKLILNEEFFEAMAAEGADLRAELVQVAAVAVAWIEDIDRRGTNG